ncbi:MAG: histidine kinase [Saprospiraceae bacterium]|nr:histidine kinase [Saprospiraceae bacterium]
MKKNAFLYIILILFSFQTATQAQYTAAKERRLTDLLDTLKQQLDTRDIREVLQDITKVQNDGIEDYPELNVRYKHLQANQLKRLGLIDSALQVMDRARLLIEEHSLDHRMAGNHLFTAGILKAVYRSKEALEHYRIAEAKYREEQDERNLAPCLTQIAATLASLGRYDEAKEIGKEAIALGEKLQVPKVSIQIYNNVGLVYRNSNDLLNCARMYFKGYELAKADNLPTYATALAVNLSTIYEQLCQYEKALEYSQEAVYWSEQINYKIGKYKALIINTNMALLLGKIDSAEGYVNALEAEALVGKNNVWEPAIENLKGKIALQKGELETAIQHHNLAKKLAEEVDARGEVLTALLGTIDYAFQKEAYIQCLIYMDKALSFKLLPKNEFHILEMKHVIHKKLGNPDFAYETLLKSKVIQDSIHSLERLGLLALIEADYELRDKESKIERLEFKNQISEQKNQRNQLIIAALAIFLLLLGGLGYYFSRHERLKLEKSLAEVKQALLRLQINPHFIFNTLNSIQSSFLQQNEEKTIYLFGKFSSLMRQVLQNSTSAFVPLSDEIELLINYLELEKIRSNNKFDYQVDIEEGIDIYEAQVPSMVLQIFIENAIWHGVGPKESRGHIRILVSQEQGRHKVTVEDDGVGRTFSLQHKSKDQKNKKSLGTDLVFQRIQQLNRKFGRGMQLNIRDRATQSGTRVELLA